MFAVLKIWVISVLLFYNVSSFANQCAGLFSDTRPSLMTLAYNFEANPKLEFYPRSSTIQTPHAEIKIMNKRIGFYKQRVEQLSGDSVADWFKPIQEQYIGFISKKLSDLEKQVQVISKNPKITLYDYTALIIRLTYIGQSVEAVIFSMNNAGKKQERLKTTRTFTDYKSLAFETTMAEIRSLDKLIYKRIEQILNEQKRVYEESGFKLRPLLSLISPTIKIINRLSAQGYSVISVPKTYIKADGITLSVINYLNHDLSHLSLRAGFLIPAVPSFFSKFRNNENFALKKRSKYLKKINKFNQKFFKKAEELPALESYLLETIYFYIVHEKGLPPEKAYFKTFFKMNPSISIANEIHKALSTKEWGYDSVIENSQNLKFDILLAITKVKKLF